MNSKDAASAIPSRDRLAALDGLRALAALQVLASHAHQLLWWPKPPWTTIGDIAIFPFRYGVQAVMFFFVLSGFVNHLKQAQALAAGDTAFDPRRFLWQRVRRLYPALLFSLLFTYAIDRIGGSIAPEYYYPPDLHPSRHAPILLIGTLLFLQNIAVRPFGTNGPLWALSYLWWFPVLYALAYLPIRRRIGPDRAFGIALTLSGVAAAAFTLHLRLFGAVVPATPAWLLHVVACMGMWFLGAWLAEHVAMGFQLRRPALWLVAMLLGIGGLAATHDPQGVNPIRDWLWAGLSGGIILVAISPQESPLVERFRRGLGFFAPLAASSYTQYVTQYPLLAFVRVLFLHYRGAVPSQPWVAIGMALAVILLARALAPLIETPFVSAARKRALKEA
jgi:peptidoglycan/LPS O-acetylase OafA/YrhL